MKKRRGESGDFALSQHQVEELLKVCTEMEERVTIGCQIYLGLRISELAHMRADWVTVDGNLKIPAQQACKCAECAKFRDKLWKPKTRSGARTLPIPPRIKRDLAELFKVKPYGMEVSRVGLYYRTKTLLKRARIKFKGLSGDTGFPHCLRATCFNLLVEGGMSAAGLAYFAGWSNIAIASHYISLVRAKGLALREATAIFGK